MGRLQRVKFQNLRALADVAIDLEPFTVIVGPNGCGKSTVLDEVERLCWMTHPGAEPGGPSRHMRSGAGAVLAASGLPPTTFGEKGPMRWEGQGLGASWSLSIPAPQDPSWLVNSVVSASVGAEMVTLGPLPPGGDGPTVDRLNRLAGAHLSWRVQRLAPAREQILAPAPMSAPLDRLHPSGHGLATVLLHMAANSIEAYIALQDDLRAVVPHFERLYIRSAASARPDQAPPNAYEIDLSFKGSGRIPGRYASEGTLFALALLTALHGPDMPDLILLDDIDHGLHLGAQFQIIQAIRRVMARRPSLQVLCTTHSPYLFEGIRPEELRVMALDAAGHARIKPLMAHPDFAKLRAAYTVGEIWAGFGEDWVVDD